MGADRFRALVACFSQTPPPPSPPHTPGRNSGPCAQKMRIQVKSYRDRHFHLVGKDDDDDYGDGDAKYV